MKRARASRPQIIAFVLLVLACALGVYLRQDHDDAETVPRARWNDGKPLGGKGLRLLLQRLNYAPQRQTEPMKMMPAEARVWLLLDPKTNFSRREAELLLKWVQGGGTLIWAVAPESLSVNFSGVPQNSVAGEFLREKLAVALYSLPSTTKRSSEILPPLTPLNNGAASIYWSGVRKISGAPVMLTINRPFLEIAGTPVGTQIARFDIGRGQVFAVPSALLFTNYALSKPDNAVFVTNLIRVHAPRGAIYFDERAHGELAAGKITPSLLYYLWQPPLRWAMLQLLVAALLLWGFYGRRLGPPLPLPEQEPVTRASQFAVAMGTLFQKVQRPQAAAHIIGDEFRREVTQRLGLSPSDPDSKIAQRAADVTGLPAPLIDRLLLHAKAPRESEVEVLSDTQEMETVLQRLRDAHGTLRTRR